MQKKTNRILIYSNDFINKHLWRTPIFIFFTINDDNLICYVDDIHDNYSKELKENIKKEINKK